MTSRTIIIHRLNQIKFFLLNRRRYSSLYSWKCMCKRLSEIRFCYETSSTTRTVQEEENSRGDTSLYFNTITVLVFACVRKT